MCQHRTNEGVEKLNQWRKEHEKEIKAAKIRPDGYNQYEWDHRGESIHKNLINPTHTEHSDNARRAILRLYTLETPLYRTLNRANSCQDQRVIDTLGPFAWLL